MTTLNATPVDMDGVQWTHELADVIQDIRITFIGSGIPNADGSVERKGKAYISELSITDANTYSFKITAYHPITGNTFSAAISVSDDSTSKSFVGMEDIIVNAVILPPGDLEIPAEIKLIPSAITFLPPTNTESSEVEIKTNSPIITTIMQNTISIELDDLVNKYAYNVVTADDERDGIKSVNGVLPINGNIDIKGVGSTSITTVGGA